MQDTVPLDPNTPSQLVRRSAGIAQHLYLLVGFNPVLNK